MIKSAECQEIDGNEMFAYGNLIQILKDDKGFVIYRLESGGMQVYTKETTPYWDRVGHAYSFKMRRNSG